MKDAFLIPQQDVLTPVSARFNDLVIENHDIKTVEGPRRKTQDVVKIMITRQGENLIYPSYGALLQAVQGARNTVDIGEKLADGTKEAMAWLREMEESNDPSERLFRIVSLRLDNTASPNEKILRMVVELENGDILKNAFLIKTEEMS